MTLSEELTYRGFVNQTTYKDVTALDGNPITFYWGVDPSADSMTVGNLAMAMMVRHFIDYGHKAILLVGGATGLIGDPDGKKQERDLQSSEQIEHNKAGIIGQYQRVFAGQAFETVDNYDWFKDVGYLEFLRDVGKHVPMRQMLGRDFVQSRLGEDGAGISYAEFSYALIQGYDFLHLHRQKGASLQVAGADQWGNSIAGVELIRRITGDAADVWTGPLVVNKTTGVKFGKSEEGAIWLDPAKTTPTQFYQFWVNCDDAGVEDYLKIYTMLSKEEIEETMKAHRADPPRRVAQNRLANEVTMLVHGKEKLLLAQDVTAHLMGADLAVAGEAALAGLRSEIPSAQTAVDGSIVDALVVSGLASSNTEARRFIKENAISVNGQKVQREQFEAADFRNGYLMLRRGKAFKDSALVELQD
ncbi:MAG TPA: tyrosine--tRNA ligase [Candidatus Saccharimonadales bacterium]|nr:tyrosine--tRNA ligase [Candidatus Saccharimonadales bacterium]